MSIERVTGLGRRSIIPQAGMDEKTPSRWAFYFFTGGSRSNRPMHRSIIHTSWDGREELKSNRLRLHGPSSTSWDGQKNSK
ncbi:hypothetical protein NPIL_397091 [Nephila pilipes]|uniref:Uncharacterized protein n=1 Tax=Nephila pilipes TaxID=299642 RepID=A0A8X6T687_NEPPI|nr:hypothetical protein NPIL_397091 [Nephila pilipes]